MSADSNDHSRDLALETMQAVAGSERTPRIVSPHAMQGGISIAELQVLASMANTPIARRRLLQMALIGTGVVTGLTLTPRAARAEDASSADAGSSDGGSSQDGMSSADTSSDQGRDMSPPVIKTLPVFVNWRGGANTQFFSRHRGTSAPESSNGPIIAPPQTQQGVPPGYLMVPSANGTGTEHFFHKRPDILVMDVDHKTNSHQDGYNLATTGDLDASIPSPAVLYAYRYRPLSPFAHAVGPNVGLPATGGLPVGANSLDTGKLKKIAQRNVTGNNELIFPNQVVDYLTTLNNAEIQKVLNGNFLPRMKRFANGLAQTQNASTEIQKLLDLIGKINQAKNNPYLAATMIAIALFKEGYLASLSLARSGWDNHRESMGTQSMPMFDTEAKAFDAMMSYAESQKDPEFDDIGIFVTTDFSRKKIGNDEAAHWPIGSWYVMGGPVKGKGPRRIGLTDDEQELVGEKATGADAMQHVRNLIGVGDTNFPVKTLIPDLTSPHRVQDILDGQ